MTIHILPLLTDNYAYVIEHVGTAIIIDPGEAAPVLQFLKTKNLRLTHILCTHHHGDHVGGVVELKKQTGASVIGAAADHHRLPFLDVLVKDGDITEGLHVIETPGHTQGHICYYSPALNALFAGDTLFSLGCGRLLEGSADQMWASLQKLMALPDETLLYAGHEYTASNARFCLSIDPDNQALQNRAAQLQTPTYPVTLSTEKQTNIFLKAKSPAEFAGLRTLKDNF